MGGKDYEDFSDIEDSRDIQEFEDFGGKLFKTAFLTISITNSLFKKLNDRFYSRKELNVGEPIW